MTRINPADFPERKIFTVERPSSQSRPGITVISMEKVTAARKDFLADSMRLLTDGLTPDDFTKAGLDHRTPERYSTPKKAGQRIADLAVAASSNRPNAPYLLFNNPGFTYPDYDAEDVIGFVNLATEQLPRRERLKQLLTGQSRFFTGWLRTEELAGLRLDPVQTSEDAFWATMAIAERTELKSVRTAVIKNPPSSPEITVIEHTIRMPSAGFKAVESSGVNIEGLQYAADVFECPLQKG